MSCSKLRWLASEPFRLFFISGALWSVVGVSLWPLYLEGRLGLHPGIMHARIMTEVFLGAFVVGFLGTAGPRMASAPHLTVAELGLLLFLHGSAGIFHVLGMTYWGDAAFLAMLVLLLAALVTRVVRTGSRPPPPLILALTGLLCGIAGATLWLMPSLVGSPAMFRLAGLLLYQGFLLPPVLGIGAFIFPRMLGQDPDEDATKEQMRGQYWRALAAALLLVASFFMEAWDMPRAGGLVRAATAGVYLLIELRGCFGVTREARGSLGTGLLWALFFTLAGLVLPAFLPAQRIGLTHTLYVAGFGLITLLVASRVLFGHSGDLARFAKRSWFVRCLVTLAVLAALTRATADFFPVVTASHYEYAAWCWAAVCLMWLTWHGRRFFREDRE